MNQNRALSGAVGLALALALGAQVSAQQQAADSLPPTPADELQAPPPPPPPPPPEGMEVRPPPVEGVPPPPAAGWDAMDVRSGRHGRWDQAQSQPSTQEMQDVLELLKEQDPQLAQRLEAIRQSDPERARQMLGPHVPGLMHLAYLKKTDPQRFELRMQDMKLDRQSRDLAQQIRALTGAEQGAQTAGLRQELQGVLAQQFEVRQQLQEKMVQDLQQRLEKLRQEVQQRKAQKDQLINQRLEEMLRQDEGPRW